MPQITLPDKSSRDFSSSLTIEELAADIGPGLAKATVAATSAVNKIRPIPVTREPILSEPNKQPH